jgi:hypothetical protein
MPTDPPSSSTQMVRCATPPTFTGALFARELA